jgi:hypothetical protein
MPWLTGKNVWMYFALSSLWGKFGGLHAFGATFPYIVPPPNIFLTRLFPKWRLKRKDVLRQNSMRTENSTIPSREGCPIQVIPSPSSAKNLSRGTRAIPVYVRMEDPDVSRRHIGRIRQPDRTGGAALPGAHEKGRDLRLWCEFFRLVFPSRVRDVYGPGGSSEYTQRAGILGGVRPTAMM